MEANVTTGCCVDVAPLRRPGLLARVVQAQALWRSRRRLAVLDDAALRDLGLSREEALEEASKPVWNVPSYWLR